MYGDLKGKALRFFYAVKSWIEKWAKQRTQVKIFATVLSSLIFIFGFYIIIYGYPDTEQQNTIQLIIKSEKNVYGEISINFTHKKPVQPGDKMEIDNICTEIYQPFFLDNVTRINEINLYISGRDDSIIRTVNDEKPNYKLTNIINKTTNSQIICNSYEDDDVIFVSPNLNKEFKYEYLLIYRDLNGQIGLDNGSMNLLHPISCLTDVEVWNLMFNKEIIYLTGILIVLGSFPFGEAFVNLLKKS